MIPSLTLTAPCSGCLRQRDLPAVPGQGPDRRRQEGRRDRSGAGQTFIKIFINRISK